MVTLTLTMQRGPLVLLILALAVLSGCRREVRPPAPVPADVEGRIAGRSFDARTGGLGGVGRLTLTVESRAFARVHVWVDSLTSFVGAARDSVDWRLPQLLDAHVRVWFRGNPSTPNNDEIWAKADVIAIDSLGTPKRIPNR